MDEAIVVKEVDETTLTSQGIFSSSVYADFADSLRLSLLNDLDIHVQCGGHSLSTVAAQDRLFLDHEFILAGILNSLDKSYCIFDSTTALLNRLQTLSGSDDRQPNGYDNECDNFKCEKFLANLEHLLRCLKQIALDAIIRHYFGLVAAHIFHWHNYWQHQKRIDEGWFAEWPNGQRPLSTTWPWNIKPSLFVLWGVCWMFYGSSGQQNSNSRTTRNLREAAQEVALGGNIRTRQLGSSSLPNTQALPISKKTPSLLGNHVCAFC